MLTVDLRSVKDFFRICFGGVIVWKVNIYETKNICFLYNSYFYIQGCGSGWVWPGSDHRVKNPDPTVEKNGSGSYPKNYNKIHLLLYSFDIKVNIIEIAILYNHFGQLILEGKFNFRWILYLDVQTESGSDLISKRDPQPCFNTIIII